MHLKHKPQNGQKLHHKLCGTCVYLQFYLVSIKFRIILEATEWQRFFKNESSMIFPIQYSFFGREVWTTGQGVFSNAARLSQPVEALLSPRHPGSPTHDE